MEHPSHPTLKPRRLGHPLWGYFIRIGHEATRRKSTTGGRWGSTLLEYDGTEQADDTVVWPGGEEQGVLGTVGSEPIAEVDCPKLRNDDGIARGVTNRANKIAGDGVERVDGSGIGVIGDQQRVAEWTEIAGRSGEAPGLVQMAA